MVVGIEVRVCVSDDDPSRIDALLLQDVELGETGGIHRGVRDDRGPRPTVCPGGSPKDPLLHRAEQVAIDADLADDTGPDVAPVDPLEELADHALRQAVGRGLVDPRRIERATVPARRGNDVDPARLGRPAQQLMVAAQVRRRAVHDADPPASRNATISSTASRPSFRR
jgi:hypothetical protein